MQFSREQSTSADDYNTAVKITFEDVFFGDKVRQVPRTGYRSLLQGWEISPVGAVFSREKSTSVDDYNTAVKISFQDVFFGNKPWRLPIPPTREKSTTVDDYITGVKISFYVVYSRTLLWMILAFVALCRYSLGI